MRRGFTLIEVLVSLSISVAVLAIATGLTATAMRDAKRSRVRSDLARDASLLDGQLRRDLMVLGLGVPVGRNITPGYGTGGISAFYAPILVAAPTEIGFIADLPRPDAQMSPFGYLPNQPLGGTDRILWHNDSNGACLPDATAGSCSTADTSVFFPGEAGCAAAGAGLGSAADRVCPWSMKRLAILDGNSEAFQVVAGDGTWVHTKAKFPATLLASAAAPRPLALQTDTSWHGAWANVAPRDPPMNIRGQGFVTTIDRIFYKLDTATGRVVRVQCWGDPDPNHPNWPDSSATAIPPFDDLTDVTPHGGTPYEQCTTPEVFARNVTSVSFRYFDNAGAELTGIDSALEKMSIRRIDYVIQLHKETGYEGHYPVEESLEGSIAVRNP